MKVKLMPLATGQTAPQFALPDASGQLVTLAGFQGNGVVVYFYPKAETPGCTVEACDFRDNLASLQGAGYSVLGISPDSPEDLAAFADNHAVSFPLLSDPDNAVANEWGAYGEKQVNGSTVIGIIRSTVVVSGDGTVQHAEYGVNAEGHVARLREQLGVA